MGHVREEHWTLWTCRLGCPRTFHHLVDLHKHAIESHQESFPEENKALSADILRTLDMQSRHSSTNIVEGPCKICSFATISTEEQYQTHVGNHLESIALLALPKADGREESRKRLHTQEHEPNVAYQEAPIQSRKEGDPSSPRHTSENPEGHILRLDTERSKRETPGSLNKEKKSWRKGLLRKLARPFTSKLAKQPSSPAPSARPYVLKLTEKSSSSVLESVSDRSMTTVSDEIIRSTCQNVDGNFFVPQDIIDSLRDEAIIRAEITRLGWPGDSTDRCVEYVLKAPAIKIFLTLAACELIKNIDHFQRIGLNDEDLPLDHRKSSPDSRQTFASNSSVESDKRLPSGWGLAKRFNFLERQWMFLAPVFTNKNFVHVLNKRCPVPILNANQHGGYPKMGNFSSVKEITLHPAHQKVLGSVRYSISHPIVPG